MKQNRLQLFSILLSYGFFIFVIVISVNAVVPEEDLPVLEQKEILIEKINNNFSRDKNSVYEILEIDNNQSKEILEPYEDEPNIKIVQESSEKDDFRIQFASFKEKQKSVQTSSQLIEKMSKMPFAINLIIKEVEIEKNQIFFRVISESKYSFREANNECKKLKKNQIECIIIKN